MTSYNYLHKGMQSVYAKVDTDGSDASGFELYRRTVRVRWPADRAKRTSCWR